MWSSTESTTSSGVQATMRPRSARLSFAWALPEPSPQPSRDCLLTTCPLLNLFRIIYREKYETVKRFSFLLNYGLKTLYSLKRVSLYCSKQGENETSLYQKDNVGGSFEDKIERKRERERKKTKAV